MVIITESDFNHESYNEHFKSYPFPLSGWQKHAIKSIIDGNHALVVAPTGNGKTLPAEFAIEYFHSIGKKVIYTSPIKALSNQKCYDLKNKFPHISFGILTGDIKDNPDADCVICTTEILRNACYQSHELTENNLDFNINLKDDVAAVVFDEVHYINDKDRGNVWEECFMLLPQNTQFIMLSATIANPERFAKWIETIDKPLITKPKQVSLCSTDLRIVPSEHYFWFSIPSNLIIKKVNDKETLGLVEKYNHKMTLFKAGGVYRDKPYHDICKLKYILSNEYVYGKQEYVLNQLLKHLLERKILPAICFVYSRKNVEKFANMCNISLFEDCSKIQLVEKECESILRKLPNFKEYIILPEYKQIIKGLEKGIGIHHAGILPVFKEMIELLFDKGYIRLLFATETFAVGINFPAPTVIFTDVKKFDGTGKRMLFAHEYTQQSGRAGRRGYDTKGNVIHLLNLFDIPEIQEYKIMMNDKPQTLTSKFKISYPLLLNLYALEDHNPNSFAENSMIKLDIDASSSHIMNELVKLEEALSTQKAVLQCLETPTEIIINAIDMETQIPMLKNKKLSRVKREYEKLVQEHKTIYSDIEAHKQVKILEDEIYKLQQQLEYTAGHIKYNIECVNQILHKSQFLNQDVNYVYSLTEKGTIATMIKEVHSLVFTDVFIENEYFNKLNACQIAAFFSCFTNINVSDEYKIFTPSSSDYQLQQVLELTKQKFDYYFNIEVSQDIYTGVEYNIIYDISMYIEKWWSCTNEQECMQFISELYSEKGIFIGEFVKAILKINNIAVEVGKIAEFLGNMELLANIKSIHDNTLKFVVTNQSLYV